MNRQERRRQVILARVALSGRGGGLMRWFRRRPRVWKPEQVDDPDPMMRDAVARAMNIGWPAVAIRKDDGTWEVISKDE